MIKTAEQARALAKKNESGAGAVKRAYLQYMELIQRTANEGKYSLVVHGPFTGHEKEIKEVVKLLKEKGFTVTKHTDVYDDICCEDVYYRISWKESYTLWERIKEWFC